MYWIWNSTVGTVHAISVINLYNLFTKHMFKLCFWKKEYIWKSYKSQGFPAKNLNFCSNAAPYVPTPNNTIGQHVVIIESKQNQVYNYCVNRYPISPLDDLKRIWYGNSLYGFTDPSNKKVQHPNRKALMESK